MDAITLPLDSLVMTIGLEGEPGPTPYETETANRLTLPYDQITPDLLRHIQPDMVVSWLFCARYDACDVADMLSKAEFRGRYRAAAAHLPKAAMVEREIRSQFPTLDFAIECPVTLDGSGARYHARLINAERSKPGSEAKAAPAKPRSFHDA